MVKMLRNLLFKLIVWLIVKKLDKKQLTYARDIIVSRLAKIEKKEEKHPDKDLKGNKGVFPHGNMPPG